MSDETRDGPARSTPGRLELGAVLELSPEERDRWIDESSAGNAVLRGQLREMLRRAEAEQPHLPSQAETAFLPGSGPHPEPPHSGPPRSGPPHSGSSAPQLGSGSSDTRPAALTLGQEVGRYHVIDLLGSGGMGRVYRAVDATLGREVAIKGLSDAFRGDSRSLRRFEREARVLATLSHPNIATIYGFETLNGSPYLVLERVDGETLAQRLVRGAMPVAEAIGVALQIVAGLEEAHAKGVIHRDLKPSNVMLTRGRDVKLVDFGLAKTAAVQPDLEHTADPITQVGIVVGTARYMSPEQVRGDEVDARTDVWAFGCVLYEMLTSRPAFAGRSVSEVAAAVLRDEPDWSALPPHLPRGVMRLLRRCLRRDARLRLQHIGDARVELADLEADDDRSTEAPARAFRLRMPRWAWALAGVIAAAAVAAAVYFLPVRLGPPPPVRLSLELPTPLTLAVEYSTPYAIAPSGSLIAIEGNDGGTRRLYLRDLRDPELRRLAGTEGAKQPFFSPDGQWLAFFADRKLAKVSIAGGPVLELADVGGNFRGATWTSDGTIVIAPTQTAGLMRVPDRGGAPTPLTTLDKAHGEYSHRWPDALPGLPWVLFTVGLEDATFDEARIEAVSLETGERRVVLTGAGFARYIPNGRLLFVRGGRLYSVGFDPGRLAVRGTPEVILDAVRYDWRNGGSHLAVAGMSGTVVYTPGEAVSHEYYLSWVDHDGRVTRAVDTPRRFRDLARAHDGKRIAVAVGTATESDLWTLDANATLSQLTFGLSPYRPTWTPDGKGITVGARKGSAWQLLTIPADGGSPIVLLESANRLYPDAWMPDGRHLLFQESTPTAGWDLQSLEVDASGRPVGGRKPFAASPYHESTAARSPDGRWVAYESDELDGVVQIYVRSWPDGGHKLRASSGGGRLPAWGPNGELYYWQTGEDVLRVIRTRDTAGQLTLGAPEPVWKDDVATAVLKRIMITVPNGRFDVDPTGSRFLVLEKAFVDPGPSLKSPVVVLGGIGALDRPH